MSRTFGPWTTAIDSGSSVALSAFWKKRLRMLPRLSNDSPCVSAGSRVLLAAVGSLALGWPTLYLSSAAVAESPPQQSSAEAGQPLSVPLSDGVVAEVIGLCDHTAKEKKWWAPDGTPIAAPYQQFRSRAIPSPGQISREFAIRIRVPTGEDIDADWYITPGRGFAGGRPLDANGKWVRDIDAGAAILDGKDSTGTIGFRVAAGNWKTMTETDGKSYWSQGKRNNGFAFTPAHQLDDSVMITISHNLLGQDVRIIAVGADGKTLAVGRSAGGGAREFVQTTGIFENVNLSDVREFQLQARPYRRFELRDVALHQGQQTKPRVVETGKKAD